MKPKRSEAGWATLIELLVVTVIILIVIYMLYGRPTAPSGAGTEVDDLATQARTRPGAALEQARAVECQQNLRGLRQEIAAYRMDAEQPPGSLAEIRGGAKACSVSGNPYAYDPATGTVRCTTPGHERF
ncbi:MAG: hypothetical protein JSV65_11885 [Armatimonadota bacterium]|nr:MAG: hypothetical protein JSV65_11885 [Armatimonadota bacterium]